MKGKRVSKIMTVLISAMMLLSVCVVVVNFTDEVEASQASEETEELDELTQTKEEWESGFKYVEIGEDLSGRPQRSVYDHSRDRLMLMTRDAGDNWVKFYGIDSNQNVELISTFNDTEDANVLGMHYSSEGNLFFTELRGENKVDSVFLRSQDGGETWEEVLEGVNPWGISEDPENGRIFIGDYANHYIGQCSEHIMYTDDEGESWTTIWNATEMAELYDEFELRSEEGEGWKHIHNLHYDPLDDVLYVTGGDGSIDKEDGYKFGFMKVDNPAEATTSDFEWYPSGAQYTSIQKFGDSLYLGNDVGGRGTIDRHYVNDIENPVPQIGETGEYENLVSRVLDVSISQRKELSGLTKSYDSGRIEDLNGNEVMLLPTQTNDENHLGTILSDGDDIINLDELVIYGRMTTNTNMPSPATFIVSHSVTEARVYYDICWDTLTKPIGLNQDNYQDVFDWLGEFDRRNLKLEESIDMSDHNTKDFFYSNINGNGYSISNLQDTMFDLGVDTTFENIVFEDLDVTLNTDESGSLFNTIRNGKISHIYLDNVVVNTDGTTRSGGLVGKTDFVHGTIIENIYGEIKISEITESDNVGGLVGRHTRGASEKYISVVRNVNLNIDIDNTHGTSIGGISGCLNFGSSSSSPVTIKDIVLRGNIKGNTGVGGIAGRVNYNVEISNVFFNGTVDSTANSANGVVGSFNGNRFERFRLDNAIFDGKILGGHRDGGLVPRVLDGAEITNSIAIGTLKSMNVNQPTGGISAFVADGGLIENCISLIEIDSDGSEVGAIVGEAQDNSTIKNCYWNETIAGIDDAIDVIHENSTLQNINEETLDNLRDEETYTEFDFDDVWSIDENINDGYPYPQDTARAWTQTIGVEQDGMEVTFFGETELTFLNSAEVYFEYRKYGKDEWQQTEPVEITESGEFKATETLDGDTNYEVRAVGSWNPTDEGMTLITYVEETLQHSMSSLTNTILAIIPLVVIFAVIKMVLTVFGTIEDDLK